MQVGQLGTVPSLWGMPTYLRNHPHQGSCGWCPRLTDETRSLRCVHPLPYNMYQMVLILTKGIKYLTPQSSKTSTLCLVFYFCGMGSGGMWEGEQVRKPTVNAPPPHTHTRRAWAKVEAEHGVTTLRESLETTSALQSGCNPQVATEKN